MASAINSDNGVVSGSAGLKSSADSSGVLDLQTNGTTAISISASQVVTYTNQPTYTGGTANGVMYLNGSKAVTTGSALVFDGANLGVGVTPSAWASTVKAIQIGSVISIAQNDAASGYFGRNQYNSSSGYKYLTNSTAQLFGPESNGGFAWYQAASGTAGNAITWAQPMTLDASGNLAIGTTNSTVDRVRIKASNTTGSGVYNYLNCTNEIDSDFYVYVSGTASTDKRALIGPTTNTALAFQTNSTERARIAGSGNFGIATTNPTNLLHLAGASATPSLRLASISVGYYWDIGRENATTGDFVFNNANGGASTEKARISLSGALTLPNQPMFSAVHTATESPASGGALVQWAVYVLTNCGYSSGVFTAQVAGRYLICASLLQVAAGGIGGVYLRRNGVTLYRIFYCDDTTGYEMGSGQVIVSLAVNDTISLNQESAGITWYGDGSGLGAWTINLLG